MMGAKETSPPEEDLDLRTTRASRRETEHWAGHLCQPDSTGSKWRRDDRAIPGSRRCCTTSTRPRYCARFSDNGVRPALGSTE